MALKILVFRSSPKTVKIPAKFKKKVLPDSGRVQSTPQGAWMSNWVCGRWCPEPKCSCTGGIAGWVSWLQKRFTCPRKKWRLNRAQTPFSADIKSGAGRVTGILSQSKSSTNLYKYCMNWAKEDSSANAARVHEPNHGRYIQT